MIVSPELVLVELFLFEDNELYMLPASVANIQELVCEYEFKCISMMLQRVI